MVARWQVRSTPPLVTTATNEPRAARCARINAEASARPVRARPLMVRLFQRLRFVR